MIRKKLIGRWLGMVLVVVVAACGGGKGAQFNQDGAVVPVAQEVIPPKPQGNVIALNVRVEGADGAVLSGAQVSLAGALALTDADGWAKLVDVPAEKDSVHVVTVKKTGYVTQAIRGNFSAAPTQQQMRVYLQSVKKTLQVSQAQVAQLLKADMLGATVLLPDNALVDSQGKVVTGAMTTEMTPWDITGSDLRAMPANGRARAADGALVDLISAGMMTVNFVAADGRKLQLAPGKTAEIQMDLPHKSIGGNSLQVGSKIPLWHFDEAQGLWIEEGVGEVVASTSSATGLAVRGKVSHFSTWNWDFKFDGGGSVKVSCQMLDGALAPCSVNAKVTLPDGSFWTRSTMLQAEVTTVINMPSSGSIEWDAVSDYGLAGRVTSSTSGVVVIPLKSTYPSHSVRCTLPSGASTTCSVKRTVVAANGTNEVTEHAIPSEGAKLISFVETNQPIQWFGRSPTHQRSTDNKWVFYEGGQSSGSSGEVNLSLGNEIVLDQKTIKLKCDAEADIYPIVTSTVASTSENLLSCDLLVHIQTKQADKQLGPILLSGLPTGVEFPVTLPAVDSFFLSARGMTEKNTEVFGIEYLIYDQLTEGQSLCLRLSNGDLPITSYRTCR